jgi:hypothetical protein
MGHKKEWDFLYANFGVVFCLLAGLKTEEQKIKQLYSAVFVFQPSINFHFTERVLLALEI